MLDMKDLCRMWEWAVLALLNVFVIALVAPEQLAVLLYKLAMVSLAAYVGYWIDRRMFPNHRVPAGDTDYACMYMLRRVVIVAATMLSVALAL